MAQRNYSKNPAAKNKRSPLRVTISTITLCAFLFNIIGSEAAWALKSPSALPGEPSFDVRSFSLPQYLGTIKDSWGTPSSRVTGHGPRATDPGPRKTVIHIQDAHCNYYAQQRIAEILAYLNREYGITTVNLEGGSEDYDLSVFTRIHDKDTRRKVGDYFLKEGLLSGAEYFALNNPGKARLWGVEDVGLYLENLNVYRDFLKHKDKTDKHLRSLRHILNNLKRHIYSKELLDFDIRYNQYKTGNLEFKDYLAWLIGKAREMSIDISDLTNINLFKGSIHAEEKIDFKKASRERKVLIDELHRMLSKNELKTLVLKTVEFRKKTIPRHDYHAYLLRKADLLNLDPAEFPELQKYQSYVSAYNDIDKSAITKEISALEDQIKASLYKNDTQRELALLSKNLALMKGIFDITLTKDEYDHYKANKDSFAITNYTSFITKQAPLHKITPRVDKDITNLDLHREKLENFYEYSFKRDNAFLRNIRYPDVLPHAPCPMPHATILVTGGFHTENLRTLFKENNISYISIMPNFTNEEGYECPYFDLLSGGRNRAAASLLSHVSTLALYSHFSAHADRIYGDDLDEAQKLWVELVSALVVEQKKDKTAGNVLYAFDKDDDPSFEPVPGCVIDGKQLYARDDGDYKRKGDVVEAVSKVAEAMPCINLWEDGDINDIADELAQMEEDLKKNGRENFEEMPKISEMENSFWIKGVWEYKKGKRRLQVVKKKVGNINVIKDLFKSSRPWCCSAFFVDGDDDHVYELNLAPLRYETLNEVIRKGALTVDIRELIRKSAARTFRSGSEWFIHGDLHSKNILVKLDDRGKLIDIKFIDWEDLQPLKKPCDNSGRYYTVLEESIVTGRSGEEKDRSKPVTELEALDLEGADLEGFNPEANLSLISFKKAKLKNASFRRLALREVDFTEADLRLADFRGAIIHRDVEFTDALMHKTKFNAKRGWDFERMGYHVKYIQREDGFGCNDFWCEVTSPKFAIAVSVPENDDKILGHEHDKKTLPPQPGQREEDQSMERAWTVIVETIEARQALFFSETICGGRQAADIGAYDSVNRKGDYVIAVVGVPGELLQEFWKMGKDAGKALAEAGFGELNARQIMTFDINDPDSYWKAMEKAMETLDELQAGLDSLVKKGKGKSEEAKKLRELIKNARIVSFAPQREKGLKLAQKARNKYAKAAYKRHNITVVADAYTDCSVENGRVSALPDIYARGALARLIAFYYNTRQEYKPEAFGSIKSFLERISSNQIESKDLESLLKNLFDEPLKIGSVFEDLEQMQQSYKAIETAL